MNSKQLFRVGMACVIVCTSLLLASCDLDNDTDGIQPVPVAYVSLYNASPNAPALDVIVDNRQITNYPFEYTDRTAYLRFYTGSRNIKLTPRGASNVAVDTTVTLEADKAYSLFVADEYNKASLLVFTDTASAPAAGKALVRVINLSPDASAVSLGEKGVSNVIAADLGFKQGSGFTQVDAKTYDLEITSGDNASKTLELPDIEFREGAVYTVVVRGYSTPPSGNTNVLSAEVIRG